MYQERLGHTVGLPEINRDWNQLVEQGGHNGRQSQSKLSTNAFCQISLKIRLANVDKIETLRDVQYESASKSSISIISCPPKIRNQEFYYRAPPFYCAQQIQSAFHHTTKFEIVRLLQSGEANLCLSLRASLLKTVPTFGSYSHYCRQVLQCEWPSVLTRLI